MCFLIVPWHVGNEWKRCSVVFTQFHTILITCKHKHVVGGVPNVCRQVYPSPWLDPKETDWYMDETVVWDERVRAKDCICGKRRESYNWIERKNRESPQAGSNYRPFAYEASALPLSYRGFISHHTHTFLQLNRRSTLLAISHTLPHIHIMTTNLPPHSSSHSLQISKMMHINQLIACASDNSCPFQGDLRRATSNINVTSNIATVRMGGCYVYCVHEGVWIGFPKEICIGGIAQW